jgi:hypothetical protein
MRRSCRLNFGASTSDDALAIRSPLSGHWTAAASCLPAATRTVAATPLAAGSAAYAAECHFHSMIHWKRGAAQAPCCAVGRAVSSFVQNCAIPTEGALTGS